MFFITWKAAPMRARVYNGMYALLILLAWSVCIVAFSSEMFRCQQANLEDAHTYHFYYDRIETILGHLSFGDMNPILLKVNGCLAGGRLLVGFSSLAFICLTIVLLLSAARISGVYIPQLPKPQNSVAIEIVMSILATGGLFLALTTYGVKCYHDFQVSDRFSDVHASGYAYVIVGFFMMLVSNALLVLIKRDPPCWLGPDATTEVINSHDGVSVDVPMHSDFQVTEPSRVISNKPAIKQVRSERVPEYSGYQSYHQNDYDT